jgi:hypothetical protein
VGFYGASGFLGTSTLNNNEVATYTTASPLSVATHHIVARYGGSGKDAASESTVLLQVVSGSRRSE